MASAAEAGAALLASWRAAGAPPCVLLAVSGGGDSSALLVASSALAEAGARVCAATVDHGLRANAPDEAAQVGAACRARGVTHTVLVWRDRKPETAIQAAAREARYRLLAMEAEAVGAGAILTAHTADDLAETFLMRLARGSGAAGLSSMLRPVSVAAGAGPPVPLLRPLLGLRRKALRAIALAGEAPVIDDPSNDDPRFERVRARRFLAGGAEAVGLGVESLAASARRLSAAAEAEAASEDRRALEGGLAFDVDGAARLQAASMAGAAGVGLLRRIVRAVSGAAHAPDEASARRAAESALAGRRVTLGGALVAPCDADRVMVSREPAALAGRAGVAPAGPVVVMPGARILWDGRFIIENEGAAAISVAPRGVLADPPLDAAAFCAPAVMTGSGASSPPSRDGVRLRSLAQERFRGKVLRF